MNKKKIFLTISFIVIIAITCLCMFYLTRIADDEGEKPLVIFGTWSLDRIIMRSHNHNGEKNWGYGRVFREEWYIGYEVEYTSEYFRLGKQTFSSPVSKVSEISLYDYNNNGDFIQPDLFSLVETGDIAFNFVEGYENMGDIPLNYFTFHLSEDSTIYFEEGHSSYFPEEDFIPVGNQCVMLDNDTMLVGMWGDIILAHRIK